MAFYTPSIKTHYVEPSIYSLKNRIEYRLDTGLTYLSNWRLLNYNPVSAGLTAYQLTGFLEFIRTAEIMDGGKTLCRLGDFANSYAFSRLNNSNEYNLSNRNLDLSRVGYVFTNGDIGDAGTNPQIEASQGSTSQNNISTYIDLKSLFGFLMNSQIVPSSIFKELKLVFTITNLGDGAFQGVNAPLLAVDELVNTTVVDQLLREYKGLVWTELEEDGINVPAITQASLANGAVQRQAIRAQVKGFDNKMTRRVFIQKKISDASLYADYGVFCSPVMLKERLQVRKNGQNIFPNNGLDTPALIQNVLLETFGEMNKPVLTPRSLLASSFLGGDEYLGFDLTGDRCNELQIEYERSVVKDSGTERTGVPMTLRLFGEVLKQLTVQNGQYRVTYV